MTDTGSERAAQKFLADEVWFEAAQVKARFAVEVGYLSLDFLN